MRAVLLTAPQRKYPVSRRLIASVAIALLVPTLAACGSDDGDAGTAKGLDAVSISGEARNKVFCQENRTGSYHLSDIEVL